jgi:1-acyl-sn-glycerol-3-phosphate acyltransferase
MTDRDDAGWLLDEIRRLVAQTRNAPESSITVRWTDSLDRDLGLDSLARAELAHRLRARMKSSPDEELDESALFEAETAADLMRRLRPAARSVGDRTLPVMEEADHAAEPRDALTLQEVLAWHAERTPDRMAVHLHEDAGEVDRISYGGLYEESLRVAAALVELGLAPGETAAIMLPTGRAYFVSFYGILLAGGIPVPLYPPTRPSQIEDHLRRQTAILANAESRVLITFPRAVSLAGTLGDRAPCVRNVVTADELRAHRGCLAPRTHRPDEIALLQYTSGSTGDPKGVVLTHANLLANIRAIGRALEVTSEDRFVSWLPLYHDMGLIGACLGTMYFGVPLLLMSPFAFLSSPVRWLRAIHEHRATLSAGPNFAYELCLNKIEESQLSGIDLSSWRAAMNGAEPVSVRTIERFRARFAPYGFRPDAVMPVYGLAESSLVLTFPLPLNRPLVIDRVERGAFSSTGDAVIADSDDAPAFVGCGRPLNGHEVRILDDHGREAPDRRQGRLWFRGPSATSGYYRNPEATRRLIRDGWIDSGDLAYTVNGEVFVTGRIKDLIIRAGHNLHPHEVEEIIGAVPGCRKGCVAIFGSPDPVSGTERLVIVAETRLTEARERSELEGRIRAAATDEIGAPPDEIVLAPPGTVPKTSSGKIRRSAARERYAAGRLLGGETAGWRTRAWLLRLDLASHIKRGARGAAETAYSIWVWSVFLPAAITTWIAVAVLPGSGVRWRFVRVAARAVLALGGIRLTVEGSPRGRGTGRRRGTRHLEAAAPVVAVSNHCSYIDGVILAAACRRDLAFVAKRELLDHWISRIFLERLGAVFVERFDPQEARDDTERIVACVRAGRSLAVFPEGTFLRSPGLLPFRLGAFLVAARTGTPVAPVAVRGTRTILRDGQWLVRRHAVTVSFGDTLTPREDSYVEAVRLRDLARAFILREVREPDVTG